MDQREKFEAWADGAGFGLKYRESMFAAWEGALAASAPVVAMTDEQIIDVAKTIAGGGFWISTENDEAIAFARAIEARSGVNAQLVAALQQMVSWFGRYPEFVPVPEAYDNIKASIKTARVALVAAGEEDLPL